MHCQRGWPLAALALHLACLATILPSYAANRQLHIRDLPDRALPGCDNTISGRWYVADDQGRVCPRHEFDSSTGCCSKTARQHQCDTCNPQDQCCSSYEQCVSCCMTPGGGAEERLRSTPRGLNKPETRLWGSVFEFCAGVCRTSSRSTQHENAYILDRRFCFSELGRPLEAVPPAPPLPSSVTLVAGDPGASCDAACSSAGGLACAPEHFSAVNDCNTLRARFPCEAGCVAAAHEQHEFPGYVVNEAPKHQWPALCSVLPPAAAEGGDGGSVLAFDCSAAADHVQRVCPCQAAPAQAQGAGGGEAGGRAGGGEAGVEAAGEGEQLEGQGGAAVAGGGATQPTALNASQGT